MEFMKRNAYLQRRQQIIKKHLRPIEGTVIPKETRLEIKQELDKLRKHTFISVK